MARTALLVGLLLVAVATASQAVLLCRQVLLPDGKPAAGVQIVVRTYDGERKWQPDVSATTDAEGRYSVEVPLAGDLARDKYWFHAGYVAVAAPGCAVTLALLAPRQDPSWNPQADGALRLVPAFEVRGRVVDAEARGVGEAEVTVVWARRSGTLVWTANDPQGRYQLPVLTTRTAADGGFTLPGVVMEGTPKPTVYLSARAGERRWSLQFECSRDGAGLTLAPPQPKAPPAPLSPLEAAARVSVEPEPGIVKRQVFLPDGSPAVGAKVIVRVFRPDGTWEQDYTATTDAEGRFRVSADVTTAGQDPARPLQRPYALIDMPGCALTVAFTDWVEAGRLVSPPPKYTLQLLPDSPRAGVTLGPDKAPLAGARVQVLSLQGAASTWRLNDAARGISTPAAGAVSAADGSFALRAMAVERDDRLTARFTASAPGLTTRYIPYFNTRPGPTPTLLQALLTPPVQLSGTVTATGGTPLPGATVKLLGEPAETLEAQETVQTDAAGRFTFASVPEAFELYVLASHPQHAQRWQRVETAAPQQEPRLALPPLTTVGGTLVDEAGGGPPIAPRLGVRTVSGTGATTRNGYSLPRDLRAAPVAADGSFTVEACVGENSVSLDHFFYQLPRDCTLTVPAEGLRNVVLKVARKPAFFLRVTADDPAKLRGLSFVVRDTPDGKPYAPGSTNMVSDDRLCFWGTRAWGDRAEIQFRREREPVTDWLPLTASQDNWPGEVRITR